MNVCVFGQFLCCFTENPHLVSLFVSLQGKVAQTACMSACKHISTSLMQLLLDPEVRQISMGALHQLNTDVKECEGESPCLLLFNIISFVPFLPSLCPSCLPRQYFTYSSFTFLLLLFSHKILYILEETLGVQRHTNTSRWK